MKTTLSVLHSCTRVLPSALLSATLLLAGCKSALPAPNRTPPADAAATASASATGTAPLNAATDAATGQGGSPISGDNAIPARATSPAVASLAQAMPGFDGLYWSPEVGVEPRGEQAVRLVSGLPCSNLIGLLSAGEWRVVQQAAPGTEQSGLAPYLALLEKGEQSALVNIKDLHVAPLTAEGQPTPTPPPADAPPVEGCVGTVQVLPLQTVRATGEQQAEGQALQYPAGNGCLRFEQDVSVGLFYEGPGNFRAILDFSVPAAVGEYSVDDTDLTLQIMRSDQRFVEMFAGSVASGAQSSDSDSESDAEYSPNGDAAGVVKVQSVNPLAGEIEITDFVGDSGQTQTFRAGFQCETDQ